MIEKLPLSPPYFRTSVSAFTPFLMKFVAQLLSTTKQVLSTLDNGDIIPHTFGRLGCKVENLLMRGKGTWEDDDLAAILTGAFVTTVLLAILLAQLIGFF